MVPGFLPPIPGTFWRFCPMKIEHFHLKNYSLNRFHRRRIAQVWRFFPCTRSLLNKFMGCQFAEIALFIAIVVEFQCNPKETLMWNSCTLCAPHPIYLINGMQFLSGNRWPIHSIYIFRWFVKNSKKKNRFNRWSIQHRWKIGNCERKKEANKNAWFSNMTTNKVSPLSLI